MFCSHLSMHYPPPRARAHSHTDTCARVRTHTHTHTHTKPVVLTGQDRPLLLSAHIGQMLSGSPCGKMDGPGSRWKFPIMNKPRGEQSLQSKTGWQNTAHYLLGFLFCFFFFLKFVGPQPCCVYALSLATLVAPTAKQSSHESEWSTEPERLSGPFQKVANTRAKAVLPHISSL